MDGIFVRLESVLASVVPSTDIIVAKITILFSDIEFFSYENKSANSVGG